MIRQPDRMAGVAPAACRGDFSIKSWICAVLWLCCALGSGVLSGCDTTALGITEVAGPGDTADTRGPYVVTVYTRGPVAKARIEASYGPDDVRRAGMESLGDGRFLGRMPGAPAGTGIAYEVILTSYAEETLTAEGAPFRIVAGVVPTCLVDGDCRDAGLICDRLRGRCVAPPDTCRDDGDCGQDYFCPEPGSACRFRPLTCTPEGACPQGYVCADGRCVTAPPCTADAECASGQTCLTPPGRCVGAPECVADADCPRLTPRCDLGRCVEGPPECGEGRPCGPGLRCTDTRCVPIGPCGPDRPCPPGEVCDDASGQCLPEPEGCRVQADCPAGQSCLAGRCVNAEGCRTDSDCPDDRECVNDQCQPIVRRCEQDANCADGDRCAPQLNVCGECYADGHCPGGRCDMPAQRCVPGERTALCGACGPDDPCFGEVQGLPLICAADAGLPLCLPRCDGGGGCPQGYFCDGRYCQGSEFCAGSECRVDDQCEGGACEQGLCVDAQRCREPRDCAADAECRNGLCRPRGQPCDEARQCPSGTGCFLGHCVESALTNGCQPCESIRDCETPGYCLDVFGDNQQRCLSACGLEGCQPDATCQTVAVGISLCIPDRCEAPGVCGRDGLEPNDNFGAATQVPVGQVALGGVTCQRDVDVFRVAGLSGALEVRSGGLELLVEVWGRDQQLIDRLGVNAGGAQVIELTPRTGFLFVRGVGADTDYRITGELRAAACMDDLLEDNDSPDRATVIGNGADIQGRLCGADLDFFRLRVPNRGRFTLSLSPGANSLVRARILTNAGEVVESIDTSGNVDFDLSRYPDNARIFSVQCIMCADAGGSYRLQMR